jgi:circadian clock protein KaiC
VTNRLLSGSGQLDQVLGGGLPANTINLIAGLPGTGKTVLAHQYVFHNASPDRCAIYFATVAEPFDKLVRFGQTLSFFDPQAIGQSIFYEDMHRTLAENGLEGTLEAVERALRERRPGIVVIDSFKALHAYATDEAAMQRYAHELASLLSAFPATSFWLGEYSPDEMPTSPPSAVADAVLSLSTRATGLRETRLLSVSKLRGSGFLSGDHAYRVTTDGLRVFPRLADPVDPEGYHVAGERRSSGIALLDDMLADGYFPGSSTLVAGPTGAGKTVMGLHFVFQGLRVNEPGVIATFEEHPSQLEVMAKGFGWSLAESAVDVMYRSLVDLHVDEWVYELLETIERTGARRILIDSLSNIEVVSPDQVRFREYVYSLIRRCSRTGVSLLMTTELPDLFQVTRLSDSGISPICDNVLLLQHALSDSRMKRSVIVLKTRASVHDDHVRGFTIGSKGVVLEEEAAP